MNNQKAECKHTKKQYHCYDAHMKSPAVGCDEHCEVKETQPLREQIEEIIEMHNQDSNADFNKTVDKITVDQILDLLSQREEFLKKKANIYLKKLTWWDEDIEKFNKIVFEK